jgi:DNA-binding NarL/FixJ family response regulator
MQSEIRKSIPARAKKLTSVFVVHPHALVRAALCNLITGGDGLSVAGDSAGGEDATKAVASQLPDVVLVDCRGSAEAMDATIIGLHRAAPRSSLLALVDDANTVGGATRMLAGTVDAQCDIERLRETIATRLGLEYEPCVVKPDSHARWESVTLSRRETHVAVRIAAGLTSKQIAADLGVSLRTVHTYRESLARKLGASSAAVITRFVIERRITQTD